MRISFGPFAFDPQSRLLWRDGVEIALPPRVLGILELLIERAGDVVPRQDLLDRVWRDAFVTDTSLAEAVSFLRQALGDDSQSPTYIQTVHRRGYRFLVMPTAEPVADQGPAGGKSEAGPRAVDWQLVPWSIALLCAGLAISAVWHTINAPPPDVPPVARFELRAAPGTAFDHDPQPIAIAPDGRSLAWSACETATGRCAIYTRPVDRLDGQPLAGTDGGHAPVFSPDGRWIAFFADGALKKVAAAGGSPATLASAPDPAGATWGPDGRIVFAGSAAGGLSLVSDQGAPVQTLTTPRGEQGELRHRSPARLAARDRDGGSGLIFTIASSPDASTPGALAAMPSEASGIRILRDGVTRAVPAGPNYLLLSTTAELQAATFDDRALVLTGASDAVSAPPADGTPQFAAGAGMLAIVRAAAPATRAWSDGADASSLAHLHSIAIAPDSRRAAGVDANADLWIVELASGATTRLTFGGTNVSPTWSADGRRLYFASRNGAEPFHVVSRPVSDRTETATPVAATPAQTFPTSAASDGRLALTSYQGGHTRVLILPPDGGPARVLTDGPFDESAATFSPDGRWVALESSASGHTEVVARSTVDNRGVPISSGGGSHPQWSEDGRVIYFESGRRLLKAAFIPDGPSPAVRPEVALDRADERAIVVTPSGRLLLERQPATDTAVIVLQWLRELRERLPLPVTTPR